MDSINKLHKICAEIMLLNDVDLRAIQAWAELQRDYSHPVKKVASTIVNTSTAVNVAGGYNIEILESIKQLRILIPKAQIKNSKIARPNA